MPYKKSFLFFFSKSCKRDFTLIKVELFDSIKIYISKPDKFPRAFNCLCPIGASESMYLNALITMSPNLSLYFKSWWIAPFKHD